MKFRTLPLAVTLLTLGLMPLSAQALTATSSMTVDVTITSATGSFSTPPSTLQFGSVNIAGATYPMTVTATATVGVTVTAGSPYSIEIGLGNNAIGSQRYLSSVPNSVPYALYQTTGYLAPWGAAGTGTAKSALGSGAEDVYTIYGILTLSAPPATGTYVDQVFITLVY